ncbi:hypothetical protein GGX14DRAFT_658187 [Mycena pura]|uniref:Uncharacterized protein n=1 Tax=Mycena pura TaxID=153505 RepID=A0AAD7E2E2_9AGAR|nr:hypothetical protein GGX14DRAFT_658187 [Mycena pura]
MCLDRYTFRDPVVEQAGSELRGPDRHEPVRYGAAPACPGLTFASAPAASQSLLSHISVFPQRMRKDGLAFTSAARLTRTLSQRSRWFSRAPGSSRVVCLHPPLAGGSVPIRDAHQAWKCSVDGSCTRLEYKRRATDWRDEARLTSLGHYRPDVPHAFAIASAHNRPATHRRAIAPYRRRRGSAPSARDVQTGTVAAQRAYGTPQVDAMASRRSGTPTPYIRFRASSLLSFLSVFFTAQTKRKPTSTSPLRSSAPVAATSVLTVSAQGSTSNDAFRAASSFRAVQQSRIPTGDPLVTRSASAITSSGASWQPSSLGGESQTSSAQGSSHPIHVGACNRCQRFVPIQQARVLTRRLSAVTPSLPLPAHALAGRKLADKRCGSMLRHPQNFCATDLAPHAMAPMHRNHRRQVDEWVRPCQVDSSKLRDRRGDALFDAGSEPMTAQRAGWLSGTGEQNLVVSGNN